MAPYSDDYCGIVVKGVIQGLSDDGKSQKEVPPKAAFVYHDGASSPWEPIEMDEAFYEQ